MIEWGTVVVDLGRGSATITTASGAHGGTWSGVTTRGTARAIGRDGWELVRPFRVSPANNGFAAPVRRRTR